MKKSSKKDVLVKKTSPIPRTRNMPFLHESACDLMGPGSFDMSSLGNISFQPIAGPSNTIHRSTPIQRDGQNSDTPKKKNRRRERKPKNKLNQQEELLNSSPKTIQQSPVSSTTAQKSPGSNKINVSDIPSLLDVQIENPKPLRIIKNEHVIPRQVVSSKNRESDIPSLLDLQIRNPTPIKLKKNEHVIPSQVVLPKNRDSIPSLLDMQIAAPSPKKVIKNEHVIHNPLLLSKDGESPRHSKLKTQPSDRQIIKPLQQLSLSEGTSKATTGYPVSSSEPPFTYKINPVKKPPKFYLFKKRNSKHKRINLKSFLSTSKLKPCQFKSNIKISYTSLKNLQRLKNKVQRRKFDNGQTSSERCLTVSLNRTLSQENLTVSFSKELSYETLVDESDQSFLDASTSRVKDESVQVKTEVNQDTQTASPKKRHRKPRQKKEKHKEKKLVKAKEKESQGKFSEYITEEEMKQGVETGELIKGLIRVNQKNSRDSYVSNEDTSLSDYYITSVADRNRALDGDEVVLKVKPESEWQEGKRTAVVVYITKKLHPRTTVGILKPIEDNKEFAAFFPRDKRIPVMHVPAVYLPNGFKTNPKLFQNILFAAKLLEWNEPSQAHGVVTEALGLSGDLKVETQSILKEFCLDITPFSEDMMQYLPKSKEIPQEELNSRKDIRKECIFTIDPLTARDLDDAVSVKKLSNGHYEIGVHISDASYYLKEGTELDKMVSGKATTIYLVDNVYHMLPVELCLHCSLLPGEDKLAFSVFWEMDEQGQIFDTRFARTVLNSCSQLAYEHAQQMIENPEKEFGVDELPKIYNGFAPQDLSRTVRVLQKIAIRLREARIKNGSLRIDQVKLLFSLHPRNGEPLDFVRYENKEAHRLIEEFMLLANISVAKRICESFPDIAFLRCHEPPKQTMLVEAQKCLETCGILIDISSSGGINSSLRKYITDDYQGLCRGIVLNHIFAKPMTRARYFCASTMENETGYGHYALSVPIYTHFTSPIRRYADIMVHRLLAASLGYEEKPNWDIDNVCAIAANCNKQKYNAKRAGEASSDLYLAHYIEKHQPYIQDCVVVDVKNRSFDAIVLKTGSLVRVNQKRCEDNPVWHLEAIPVSTSDTSESDNSKRLEYQKKVLKLTIKFPKTKKVPEENVMIIEMFSTVKVKLTRVPNSYKLDAFLMRPILSKTFERSNSSTSRFQ